MAVTASYIAGVLSFCSQGIARIVATRVQGLGSAVEGVGWHTIQVHAEKGFSDKEFSKGSIRVL